MDCAAKIAMKIVASVVLVMEARISHENNVKNGERNVNVLNRINKLKKWKKSKVTVEETKRLKIGDLIKDDKSEGIILSINEIDKEDVEIFFFDDGQSYFVILEKYGIFLKELELIG